MDWTGGSIFNYEHFIILSLGINKFKFKIDDQMYSLQRLQGSLLMTLNLIISLVVFLFFHSAIKEISIFYLNFFYLVTLNTV